LLLLLLTLKKTKNKLFYRNRLKKKEWIANLQHSNVKVDQMNVNLKDRLQVLEKELTQLQDVLEQAGYSPEEIPRVLHC
jgi:hypothetical protein